MFEVSLIGSVGQEARGGQDDGMAIWAGVDYPCALAPLLVLTCSPVVLSETHFQIRFFLVFLSDRVPLGKQKASHGCAFFGPRFLDKLDNH